MNAAAQVVEPGKSEAFEVERYLLTANAVVTDAHQLGFRIQSFGPVHDFTHRN